MTKWIILIVIVLEIAFFGWLFLHEAPPHCSCPTDPVHCAQPVKPPVKSAPSLKARRPDCRWVPATAYQFNEDLVLSHAQSDYHLNPKQLRLLKYCVEHHR